MHEFVLNSGPLYLVCITPISVCVLVFAHTLWYKDKWEREGERSDFFLQHISTRPRRTSTWLIFGASCRTSAPPRQPMTHRDGLRHLHHTTEITAVEQLLSHAWTCHKDLYTTNSSAFAPLTPDCDVINVYKYNITFIRVNFYQSTKHLCHLLTLIKTSNFGQSSAICHLCLFTGGLLQHLLEIQLLHVRNDGCQALERSLHLSDSGE